MTCKTVGFEIKCLAYYSVTRTNAVKMSRAGMYFDNVRKLTVKNVNIEGCVGEKLIINNVEELETV